jgi:phage terminase Nu1 subunit (DNA packaging protein)
MNFPPKVSTSTLATLLSVNERTIAKLTEKKVLRREERGVFDVVDAIAAHTAYRESVAAEQAGQGAYGKARAQLYLERARMARLKREELEGQLGRTSEWRAFGASVATVVKNRVLGVATKVAPRLINLKSAAQAEAIVYDGNREALEEISKLSPPPEMQSKLDRRARRRSKDDDGESDSEASS